MTYESERVTRKTRVDPQLKAAGWNITLYTDGMDLSQYNKCALEEYPTENGPADYALCVDGKILAVVEAKKSPVAFRVFSHKQNIMRKV